MSIKLSEFAGNVVRVGDQCYQFQGYVPGIADAEADAVFETCEECGQTSSSADESSAAGALTQANCCATCGVGGTDNTAYPRMKVTACWTDADITKTLFGQAGWTNGESKIICPTNYIEGIVTGGNGGERWNLNAGGMAVVIGSQYYIPTFTGTDFGEVGFYLRVKGMSVAYPPATPTTSVASWQMYMRKDFNAYAPSTGSIGTEGGFWLYTSSNDINLAAKVPANPLGLGPPVRAGINPDQFGSLTTGDGLSISWEPVGTGGTWRHPGLVLGTTVANSPCP